MPNENLNRRSPDLIFELDLTEDLTTTEELDWSDSELESVDWSVLDDNYKELCELLKEYEKINNKKRKLEYMVTSGQPDNLNQFYLDPEDPSLLILK